AARAGRYAAGHRDRGRLQRGTVRPPPVRPGLPARAANVLAPGGVSGGGGVGPRRSRRRQALRVTTMTSPLPNELPEEAADLGDVTAEYQGNSWLQVGLVLLALPFLGFGIFYLTGARLGAPLLSVLAGAGFVPLAVVLVAVAFSMARLRVLVSARGFVAFKGRDVTVCRWEDIAEIRGEETVHRNWYRQAEYT